MLVRQKISEDRTGIPLRLRLIVQDSRTCTPLKGAAIDLWHCDAMGLYSGFTKTSMGGPGGPGGPGGFGPGGPPAGSAPDGKGPGGVEGRGPGGPPPQMKVSDKLTFLRGIQMTGEDGSVEFATIFPGFYNGRTNHVHFKVRLEGERKGQRYAAGHTSHTGQVFFPEDLNVKLMAQAPYADHHIHRTTEQEDGVFNGEHGASVVATLVPVEVGDLSKGLIAEMRVSVDPTAVPKPVGVGGPPPMLGK
jgi:protocatechuate 3,4-dioxygenase beta subunit